MGQVHGATAMMGQRRVLRYDSLMDAVQDAENLLAHGYSRLGNWDLAQCCIHCATLMDYPITGFPRFRFPLNAAAWVMRRTIAPRQLRKVIESGNWPAGAPTDKRTIPAKGEDDAKAVVRLRESCQRLLSHEGLLHPSPLFGMLDKQTLLELHRIHTAHHLSFLIPSDHGAPTAMPAGVRRV